MTVMTFPLCTPAILCAALLVARVQSSIVINEVADKGTSTDCGGDDWLELANIGASDVDIAGYSVHDDKGKDDKGAFTFPAASPKVIKGGEFLGMCAQLKDGTGPSFKIGGDDTIYLLDAAGKQVSTSGALPGIGEDDKTYSLHPDGTYKQTSTPTFGKANVFDASQETPEAAKARVTKEKRAEMVAQNALGVDFFDMNNDGAQTGKNVDTVVNISMTMATSDQNTLIANQSYEMYSPFTSITVETSTGSTTLQYGGRIRPRGQSTLALLTCWELPSIPFLLDFNHVNKSQTLFGMEKAYLRNHLSDHSYMRDWASSRMLARFGLPHVRTRPVNFYLNGKYVGFYTLMEAVDQEYVFARSFPSYDPLHYALYKRKTLSSCAHSNDAIQHAKAHPPAPGERMAYERGNHRTKVLPAGARGPASCMQQFGAMIQREMVDMSRMYVANNQDCGRTLVSEGRIDRDLGDKSWDATMINYTNKFNWGVGKDSVGTSEEFYGAVDVDNMLKTMATQAVMINQDSPLGNGNNFFFADSGDGNGWKIFQYDFNGILEPNNIGVVCDTVCAKSFIHWSVGRPACNINSLANGVVGYNTPTTSGSNAEMNHPLLKHLFKTDANFKKYMGYVRAFNEGVFTNADLVAQMTAHAAAIKDHTTRDSLSAGTTGYDAELTVQAGDWTKGNLLAAMHQRGVKVKEQLAAYADSADKTGFPKTAKDIREPATEAEHPCAHHDFKPAANPFAAMCKTPGAYKGGNLYFGAGGCEGGCPCEQVLISLSTDRKFAYLGLNGMDWSKYSCAHPATGTVEFFAASCCEGGASLCGAGGGVTKEPDSIYDDVCSGTTFLDKATYFDASDCAPPTGCGCGSVAEYIFADEDGSLGLRNVSPKNVACTTPALFEPKGAINAVATQCCKSKKSRCSNTVDSNAFPQATDGCTSTCTAQPTDCAGALGMTEGVLGCAYTCSVAYKASVNAFLKCTATTTTTEPNQSGSQVSSSGLFFIASALMISLF